MFRIRTEKLPKKEATRRDKIARKHGGAFVGPLTTAGNEGRSWFAVPNRGEPFNSRVEREIITECGL